MAGDTFSLNFKNLRLARLFLNMFFLAFQGGKREIQVTRVILDHPLNDASK